MFHVPAHKNVATPAAQVVIAAAPAAPAIVAFRDLPINATFEFAEPFGFSLGRQFIKVSPRKYEEYREYGALPQTRALHKYEVGSTCVQVVRLFA